MMILRTLFLISVIFSLKKKKQVVLPLPQPSARPYTVSHSFPQRQAFISSPTATLHHASLPVAAEVDCPETAVVLSQPPLQPAHPVQQIAHPVNHQVSIRRGHSVHGLMTNVAPESAGIVNPEIATPKAIKHHIIHHDNIVTENQVVGQDVVTHHRHHYDSAGNVLATTQHQTAHNIVQPVQKVYRQTHVNKSLVDLTTGQNVVFNHGPIKTHGVQI